MVCPTRKAAPAGAALVALAFVMVGGLEAPVSAANSSSDGAANSLSRSSDTAQDAKGRVSGAAQAIDRLKQDPRFVKALSRAQGVFVIAHYGKGALVASGHSGGGVVLARHEGAWTDPAFFSIGGGSGGAQAGRQSGWVVLLLMTDKALDKFADSANTWVLNANAGLTVGTWPANGQAQTGTPDVIVWPDTHGLYGGLTASTDITPDRNMDEIYYGMSITSRQLLTGTLTPYTPDATPLRGALANRAASS